MRIQQWPSNERPRERLLAKGVGSLSDAELLAILLRTGSKGQSALDLARGLLAHYGDLSRLLRATSQELIARKGMGAAKFATLAAALELARRQLLEDVIDGKPLHSAECARHYARAQLRNLPHEVFAVFYLDAQYRVTGYEELFRGTLDNAHIYPREVAKAALLRNAGALIFAHNHPSGSAQPSQMDYQLTQQLRSALQALEINVLDHLIVGGSQVTSLAELGQL